MTDFNNILKKLDDTYNHSDDPLLLQNKNSVYIISGRKGAGKSTLFMNLLQSKQAYRKRFENIFLISPTAKNDTKLKKLVKELEEDNKYFDTFSEDLIKNILEQIEEDNDENDYKHRHLICLDDCVLDLSKKKSSILNKLVIMSRHNNITLLILTQKYNAIPTIIRSNADLITFFNSLNKKEIQTLQEDINISSDLFKHVYNIACMTKDRGFLHINLMSNPIKFYSDFTPMQIDFREWME